MHKNISIGRQIKNVYYVIKKIFVMEISCLLNIIWEFLIAVLINSRLINFRISKLKQKKNAIPKSNFDLPTNNKKLLKHLVMQIRYKKFW